ncbi:MAG: holin family protein [Nitrospira sp.]|nr:holin family protein [Nitrospira sp.]
MWQMLVGPVSDLLNTVLKRVLPPEKMSESERAHIEAELKLALMEFDWKQIVGQLEINKEEAKHASIFVAGWRPACGWVGAVGLSYHFVVQPLAVFTITMFKWQVPPLPEFDMYTLTTLLFGMLGLGGLRTYEKFKGVNRESLY